MDSASAAYEHADALALQLGDPCWEGAAARWLQMRHGFWPTRSGESIAGLSISYDTCCSSRVSRRYDDVREPGSACRQPKDRTGSTPGLTDEPRSSAVRSRVATRSRFLASDIVIAAGLTALGLIALVLHERAGRGRVPLTGVNAGRRRIPGRVRSCDNASSGACQVRAAISRPQSGGSGLYAPPRGHDQGHVYGRWPRGEPVQLARLEG